MNGRKQITFRDACIGILSLLLIAVIIASAIFVISRVAKGEAILFRMNNPSRARDYFDQYSAMLNLSVKEYSSINGVKTVTRDPSFITKASDDNVVKYSDVFIECNRDSKFVNDQNAGELVSYSLVKHKICSDIVGDLVSNSGYIWYYCFRGIGAAYGFVYSFNGNVPDVESNHISTVVRLDSYWFYFKSD